MPMTRLRLAAAALVAVLPLAACGGGSDGGDTIVIGTKVDQPGLGLRAPDGTMTGFDVDVATYVAGQLGYTPDRIEWREAPSDQRETLIRNGQVEFIVATYSITPTREEQVSFAGPYFNTGQSLLVRSDNTDIVGPESLNDNKRLCSVTGSTPAQKIKDTYAGDVQLQEFPTYSACVEGLRSGAVDAVTTDAVILAGYAAQSPGEFKVVGQEFSEERYGVGLEKDNTTLQTSINDALSAMIADGEWQRAFEDNIAASGYPIPAPPTIGQA